MKTLRQVLCFLLLLSVSSGLLASPPYLGRSLSEVLNELRGRGLKIVYSSEVVRPEMKIEREPRAGNDRALLDEILRPHSLTVEDGPGGTLLVVKASREVAEQPDRVQLKGVVAERGTDAPIAGARVSIGKSEASTDSEGRFALKGIPEGAHSIQARKSGYIISTSEVVVGAGLSPLRLILIPARVELEELIVTPSQYSLMGSDPEQRQFLSKQDIDQIPHLADDLFRALGRLPGTASGDISARFNVRGGEDDEVLVLLDGLQIHEPFHLKDFLSIFSIIDAEAVGGVELLPGGFPAQYGDRMSGVMDLSSSTASGENRTYAGVSFVNTRFLSQGSFREGKGEWLVSGRRGYIDIVLDLVEPDTKADPQYYDLYGKLALQLSDRHLGSANVLAALDDFIFEDGGERANANYGNQYVWLNLKSAWTDSLYSQSVIHAGRNRRERRGGLEDFRGSAAVADERSFDEAGLKQDWSLSLSDRNIVKWGWKAESLDARYDYSSQVSITHGIFSQISEAPSIQREARLRPSGNALSVYASDRVRVSSALVLEAGLRWDRQSWVLGGDDQISPRLNAVLRLGPRTSVRAAWGRYFQSQGINELEVQDGEDQFHRADKSDQVFVSVQHALPRGLTVQLDGYRKKLSRVRPRYENLFDPIELFPELTYDRVRIDPDEATENGIELLLQKESTGRIQWWASYARSKAVDRIEGIDVPRAWDQHDAASFSLNYRPSGLWNLNLAGTYHSGWPTTGLSGRLVQDSPTSGHIEVALGERNGERLKAYQRLDVRGTRYVRLKSGTLTFFLEVYNVLNRKNVCCIEGFNFAVASDGQITTSRIEDGVIGWLPSFGIGWEF